MQEKIITIYCLCADFLIVCGQKDDPQAQMSTAEVMTTALVATWYYLGNQEYARLFLKEHGYIPKMLSKNRLNRQLHRTPDTLWQTLFALLAAIHQHTNAAQDYIVDSCPVAVCDNIRIRRYKIYRNEVHRGYCASKRRYFYGLKAHLIVTATGKPVEVVLTPGATADMPGLRSLFLDLPEGADLYGDKGYTDYGWEDFLLSIQNIELTAARKKNSQRPHAGHIGYLCQVIRKRVETTFSQITKHLERSIHAVTARADLS